MPKIYLRQPGITFTACGSFTKNKERMQSKHEIHNIFTKTN